MTVMSGDQSLSEATRPFEHPQHLIIELHIYPTMVHGGQRRRKWPSIEPTLGL